MRFHGHMFSPALWERVFDSVLFPIFDYVRRASELEPVSAPLEFADEVPGAAGALGGALGGMGVALTAAGAPGASAMYSSSSFAILRHSHHKGAPLSKIASPGKKGGGGGGEEDERGPSELEMDAWLYETCTLALQLVVDLFVKFYSKVPPIASCICTPVRVTCTGL